MLHSDLEEIFSESEFEDEEVLALSDRGMKMNKALTNRVDAFLSYEDQVRCFIENLEEEEYSTAEEDGDSDVKFFDAKESLESDNEEMSQAAHDWGVLVTRSCQIKSHNQQFLCSHILY